MEGTSVCNRTPRQGRPSYTRLLLTLEGLETGEGRTDLTFVLPASSPSVESGVHLRHPVPTSRSHVLRQRPPPRQESLCDEVDQSRRQQTPDRPLGNRSVYTSGRAKTCFLRGITTSYFPDGSFYGRFYVSLRRGLGLFVSFCFGWFLPTLHPQPHATECGR